MIYISFDIGVKNLALCILNETENQTVHILDWTIISLAESKRQIKGVNNIAEVLYYELDNIMGKLETLNIMRVDKVIIENQPSNLNGIMKTIQFLIFSYFDLLRHWDKRVGEVILINASVKLQHHSFVPLTNTMEKLSRQEKYKLNKKQGIEICSYYIRNDESLKLFFNSHKKKDDLADTCLQTLAYMRKKGSNVEEVFLNLDNFL